MLKKITIEDAMEIIMQYKYSFICVLDEILFLKKNQKGLACFANDSTVLFVNDNYEKKIVYICFINESIDYGAILDFLNNIHDEFTIFINARQEVRAAIDKDVFDKNYIYSREIRGFIKMTNDSFCEPNVRLLSKKDDQIASDFNCKQESILYRPAFSLLFEIFVKRSRGDILGYFIDNNLVGYLSYNLLFDNIYDVDYIYVLPTYRKSGIGKSLATSYVSKVIDSNGLAFWSNAQNDVSEKVAKTCGFTLCREQWIYQKTKLSHNNT